eukprot:TRINITY_DN1995_c0_g1::TRINITY_DN1995_c0_g1_i1::g.22951::m.22951 TRINITY_DN1995_c0_g1::TRINITY_DN1995_c0_g1_i1::g.22951  ORF type:complete len:134 (-),score=1.48 TRINITY_DN1995_c0_g1_i1:122-523(-)
MTGRCAVFTVLTTVTMLMYHIGIETNLAAQLLERQRLVYGTFILWRSLAYSAAIWRRGSSACGRNRQTLYTACPSSGFCASRLGLEWSMVLTTWDIMRSYKFLKYYGIPAGLHVVLSLWVIVKLKYALWRTRH